MKQNAILPETPYTFSDYFKMRIPTEEILNYFGYSKKNERLSLPRYSNELPTFQNLADKIEEVLIHISLESEITRREFLIAPIIFEIRHLSKAKLNSEYWIEYNHQLRGSLDYFLRDERNLLIVEAKNADMTRGFTQLAVEMIALDKADETEQPIIYGAVTTGSIWQFGELDRTQKIVTQDIRNFDLLEDLEDLVRIFIEILERK